MQSPAAYAAGYKSAALTGSRSITHICAGVELLVLGVCLLSLMVAVPTWAGELTVGPGKTYPAIADALAKAAPGDTILVYPLADGKPYEQVAVMVRKGKITFKAVPVKAGQRVALSGKGFDFSGAGSIPRAMFQFDPQASGCVLEGFELSGAHNDSHNGAGVRINQANNVTIRNCEIHANDMGIMSNGDGTDKTGVNQRIESCLIHSNGDFKEPGQNHNLYLGGTSVTLSGCEVHSSLTGHNVKSRAHHTRIEYSYIHDSANREFDLVDAKGDTSVPDSDAVLVGNIIVKDPKCTGNKTVIHFGQDGGHGRDGKLYLVHNTIVTPFMSPVVDLSSPQASVTFIDNIIWDAASGQKNQVLVNLGKGITADAVTGSNNWLSGNFVIPQGSKLDATYVAKGGAVPPFADAAKRDYHIKSTDATIVAAGLAWSKIKLPAVPGVEEPKTPAPLQQYKAPLAIEPRPGFKSDIKGDLGAFGYQPAK